MEDIFEKIKNRPKPNLFKKIYLWWAHDGKYYHKYFKQGITNIIYWFPIIWKDRNWDHYYIFKMLQHKLKAQANYIGQHSSYTKSQQNCRNMRICINLIQKIQDNYYEMEYTDYVEDRHWFEPCNDGTGNSTWESENIWENYNEYFAKYPLIHKRVLKGEGMFGLDGEDQSRINNRTAINIANINQNRAHKLLFKIMESQIQCWWD